MSNHPWSICVTACKSIFETLNLSSDPAPARTHPQYLRLSRISSFGWQLMDELWLETLVHGYIKVTASSFGCVKYARVLGAFITQIWVKYHLLLKL